MRKYKPISPSVAKRLGSLLRAARINQGLRLIDAADRCTVDAGQLSRMERGAFKALSANLQKYSTFLHIDTAAIDETLVERFKSFVGRSPAHREACELILEALDQLSA
jgi:transcriptional regulator with XRE-family HTH domain